MPDLSEPNGIVFRSLVDVTLDFSERLPAPIRDLQRVWSRYAIEVAAEDMHDFIFNQIVRHFSAVIHRKDECERADNAHLFGQSSNSGVDGALARAWMAATGVRPKPSRMVFSGSALMQQDAPTLIANDNGYGSVPQSNAMRLKLGRRSDRDVVGVDNDHFI